LVAKVDKKTLSYLGLKKRKIHQTFYGILYAMVAVLIIVLVLVACGQYKFVGLNHDRDLKKVFLFLGAFIIYALAEELLCRGLIENHLKDKFKIHLCVFVAFVAFCIPHLIELFTYELKYSLVAILNLLIISYIFSLLLDVYDNIFVCIGFHTTWNVLFYTVIGSNINGSKSEFSIFSFTAKNSLLNGGAYGIEYGIITFIVLFIIGIILSLGLKYLHKHAESKLLLIPKNNKKTDL
jgi:membrane protease YdiL (CAAX protease family)